MHRRLTVGVIVPGWSGIDDAPALPALQEHLELLARTHDLRIVALRHPPRRGSYRDRVGIPVTALGHGARRGVAGRLGVLLGGIGTLRSLHRERPFDIIHGFWADEPGAVAVLAGRRLGVPAAVSVMGGELAALPEIGYGAAIGRGGRWLTRFALRRAAVVTVGSTELFRRAAGIAPGVPLRRLPLGVDLDRFRPGPEDAIGATGAPLRSLFAGSLTAVKDPVLLLRAFARVTDRAATLDVAGDGPLRPGLERLAAELGVADRVRFLGALDREALAERYRASDLLVVTSRHEAQSMVTAEAAACGLPVVGRSVGIIPELAAAGGGVAVRGAGPAELAAAIDAAGRPEGRIRMGAAARACAARHWDLERSVARWSELWLELDRSRGRPAAVR